VVAECAAHGVVALASAVASAAGDWELGVLVDDAHQRRGVGSAMVVMLLLDVRARGGQRIIASVGSDRRALLARLTEFGDLRVRLEREGIIGVLDLTVDEDGGRGGPTGARPA
jgi:GNAT superfamily N-acetyltransferase